VIRWATCKLGVEEWLVSAVMCMYTGVKTVVRTVYGNSSGFDVKVGMHQGSALSPLLFVIVMEAISREFSWLVSAVMSTYTGAKTVVRTVYDNSSGFAVKVACTKVQH